MNPPPSPRRRPPLDRLISRSVSIGDEKDANEDESDEVPTVRRHGDPVRRLISKAPSFDYDT